MSSHHIVRENQEPALVVDSLTALAMDHIGQLLEWSPTIFTQDETLDFYLAHGIKVDYVVSNQKLSHAQEHIKLIPVKEGFLVDSLNYLIENKYKAVNILSNGLPLAIFDFCSKINIVLFASNKRYVFIRGRYEKWKPAGDILYVPEKKVKSILGLQKIRENTFITQQDGFVDLVFNTSDYVWVAEDV